MAETKDEAIAFLIVRPLTVRTGAALFFRAVPGRKNGRGLARFNTPTKAARPGFVLFGALSPSSAVQSGHHVLIPVESGEQTAGQGCTLPRLGREEFVNALMGMDLDREDARALARSTGRSMPSCGGG